MIFSEKPTVKDIVIMELLQSARNAEDLRNLLKNEYNKNLTIFGVYKILRELKKEYLVIKTEKIYSISEEWKTKLYKNIKSSHEENSLLNIEDGEKIEFKFTSLSGLDYQWKNIMLYIKSINPKYPIFFQMEHQFWTMLNDNRKKSEYEYIQSFNKEKSFAFYSVGGNTKFDKSFKKDFSNEYIKINTGEELLNNNNKQISIYDEYIIFTIIPELEAKKINNLFESVEKVEDLQKSIENLHIEKRNIKLVVERNKKKAKILRKKLSKNFYIPKDLIEKYELF